MITVHHVVQVLLPVTPGSQQQQFPVELDTWNAVPYSWGFNYLQSTSFTSQQGLLMYGGSGPVTGCYCNDTATIGRFPMPQFQFLVILQDSGRGCTEGLGEMFGFALGSYHMPSQIKHHPPMLSPPEGSFQQLQS